MDEQEPLNQKEGLTRKIGIELVSVIFASILITLLTMLINFMEVIIRLEEQTNQNTELIKEIQKDLKELGKQGQQ